jgi:hypothetical protein
MSGKWEASCGYWSRQIVVTILAVVRECQCYGSCTGVRVRGGGGGVSDSPRPTRPLLGFRLPSTKGEGFPTPLDQVEGFPTPLDQGEGFPTPLDQPGLSYPPGFPTPLDQPGLSYPRLGFRLPSTNPVSLTRLGFRLPSTNPASLTHLVTRLARPTLVCPGDASSELFEAQATATSVAIKSKSSKANEHVPLLNSSG